MMELAQGACPHSSSLLPFSCLAEFMATAHSVKRKRRKKKEGKPTQAAKSSSHQLRKKGHLGRKAPSPEKKKAVSADQEGCRQTSQQTSPDWFEGEENAQENIWSEQACEHSAQNVELENLVKARRKYLHG